MMEIAGGIVLAVIFIRLLPLILVGGVAATAIALGLGILALALFFIETTLAIVAVVATVILAATVTPKVLDYCRKRFPKFDAVLRGDPPYDKSARQAAFLAVGGVGLVSLVRAPTVTIGIALVAGTAYVCIGLPLAALRRARHSFPALDEVLKSDALHNTLRWALARASVKAGIGAAYLLMSGAVIYLLSVLLQRLQ